MTVGYEQDSILVELLRAYGRDHGFSFQTKAYVSGAAMFAALDAGAVDAVVQTNFYDAPAGHVLLTKCSPNPVYIVTSKVHPELAIELDSAMAQLFSFNPSFNADLYEYHFADAAAQAVGYTQQEKAYLAQKPVVNVYYETSWEPFEYDRSGQAAGITPDIIRAIGSDTGIRFRFVLTSNTQDVYAGVGSEVHDTVMAVSYDYGWADDHDLLVTQPYLTGSVLRAQKAGTGEAQTAATVKDTYMEYQVRQKYPALQTISYPTYAACMKAVLNGAADCTFLNYYQASYYRSGSAYEELSYQPDARITQGIALGVTRDSDPALFSILSKSLQHLSMSTVQGILNENAAQSERFSLGLLIRRYPVPTALAAVTLGVLAALLMFLLVSADVRRRQNVRLAAAKQEADDANRAKSEFLSRMSHDMRTPLNGIIGMTYLTNQMTLPPAARENLRKIDTSSHFLLNLINDLLDMTKAESGKIELHPEPYPPAEFLQYIDAVIRPLCEDKNQQLVTDVVVPDGCVPMADKLRLNQVVFNLLSNAVKYTPEGGKITYTSHSALQPDGRLAMHIEVADNGIGMSEAFQKVLFDPFTQEGRSDTSALRGSGLGLAITKQLVEHMGGTIAVRSRIGAGTALTVELTLALAPPAAAETAAPAADALPNAAEAQLTGRHILLCEDHPLNQEIAKALLTARGMVVEVADDGQRGVEAFRRSSVGYYDAILMDIRMPVMNGYDAARAIRTLERPDAAAVPILAMTADAFEDDVRKCRDAGMNGHVPKPIDPAVLYRALAEALGAAGQ